MHSKNRPLQAPRPAGGFTRRVPLLSESEKARPSAFATGLCRNGSIRRSATFHRKPPCMSCTATTRCIRGSILRAGVPPCCQRAKAHAQRFCSGTLPSATIRRGPAFTENHPRMPCSATTGCICGNYFTRRVPSCCQRAKVHAQALPLRGFAPTAQSAAARFLRKPSPNTMFSYDRMYPWQYFARRGSSLLSKNKRACLSAFATGFCYNATIRRSATFHRKPPCMPCTATTGCVCGGILHAGVSPRYQRAKNHTQAPLRQDFAQRYNPPRPVSPENRPGMPCAVMTRCIR